MDCKICAIYEERKCFTRLYDETSRVIVVQSFNSAGSKKPRLMAVLKRHTNNPTQDERQAVEGTLRMVADRLNMPYSLEINEEAEHFHEHATF